jgi:hypothetical protein
MKLTPLRTQTGKEPVIIAPYENKLWATALRLRDCEVYALPAGAPHCVFAPTWWVTLTGRDVTFWPIDVWSSHIMTLIVQSIDGAPFKALRWAWGLPWAVELGEPEAQIETLWKRETARKAAE